MNDRPADLPDFGKPPVVEVVFSVQFATLEKFRVIHAGLLWNVFQEQFPEVQEQPTSPPRFETFGARPAEAEGPTLEVTAVAPLPRLWFLDRDGVELIQFQRDRFVHNWRKTGSEEVYPRYETIKKRFSTELEMLERFLGDHGLGELEPNQCEVTYVNHILSEEGEDIRSDPGRVLTLWARHPTSEFLGPLENGRFGAHFLLTTAEGEPFGRLNIIAEPAVSRDGGSMIALTLIARGRPSEPTVAGALNFLDIGREKIVRGFAELTTTEMHQRWERIQ